MGIDVVFAGLMVLCFGGDDQCAEPGWNTAWAVKADGNSLVCGRPSKEETELQLAYDPLKFKNLVTSLYCKEGEKGMQLCVLEDAPKALCVDTEDFLPRNRIEASSWKYFLSLGKLDDRFLNWNLSQLGKWAPRTIHFRFAEVRPFKYLPEDFSYHYWFKSNNRILAPKIANSIAASYPKGKRITISNCAGKLLFQITPIKPDDPDNDIYLRNYAKEKLKTDLSDPWLPIWPKFEDLKYLIWYYRLGTWEGTFSCPEVESQDPPTFLRCIGPYYDANREPRSCAEDFEAGSTMWPPMVKDP